MRKLPYLVPEQTEWGEFFEQFIFMEIKSWIDYFEPLASLTFWRSTSKEEVDFIIDGRIAVDVKSAKIAKPSHLRGLNALREEKICSDYILVCDEDRPRHEDGIEVLPWQIFLDQLWAGRFGRG